MVPFTKVPFWVPIFEPQPTANFPTSMPSLCGGISPSQRCQALLQDRQQGLGVDLYSFILRFRPRENIEINMSNSDRFLLSQQGKIQLLFIKKEEKKCLSKWKYFEWCTCTGSSPGLTRKSNPLHVNGQWGSCALLSNMTMAWGQQDKSNAGVPTLGTPCGTCGNMFFARTFEGSPD